VGASISQTLSNLTPGSYKFSFTAAQRDRVGRENITYQTTNQTVTVLVDGTNVGSFTPPDQNWYSYETAPILLSPGDHTLTFTNLPVPGDASILLDNIGIKENKPDVAKAAPPKKGASPGELDSRLTIELLDGSRLLGKSQDDPILFHSAFLGDLKVPVAEITSVEFKGEGADGGGNAVLSAVNGDLLIGRFVSPSLSVETGFGKSALPVKMIRSIKVSHAAESAQAPPNFPAGLVALWKGDGSGADSTGTNNALVPEGVSYASTPVGEGFEFDGNSDGLSIPASPDLDVGAGPGFTLSCWAQPGSPTTRDPLLEWREGTHLWISESGDIGVSKPGCVYANILDTLGNHHRFGSSTGLVQAGVPQHFALTYEKSSGMGSLYYNGKLVASQYLGSFTPKTDTALLIGERTVPEEVRYQGVINQISIFNRALSAEEIQALYAAQNTGPSVSQPASQPGSVMTAVIPANSPDGYSLGAVRKGTKITFQYVSGRWKSWGHIPTACPDDVKPPGGQNCRLAIALAGTDGTIGDVIATIPAGTRDTPFVFEAQEDYPSLFLRINSPTFDGPGKVVYALNVEAPSDSNTVIAPPATLPPPSYFGNRLPPEEVK
jgi:hypothetical protein